jgi:hypothetical protein
MGHSHRWRKYGRRRNGRQQWRCTRCGRLKNRRVWLCNHRWKWDRRMAAGTLKCKKCGRVKVNRRDS